MREAIGHIKDLSGGLAEWDTVDLVSRANEIGGELSSRNMTASQIRNFLDQVNRIWAESRAGRFDVSDVILLKPQLAYSAGRETNPSKKELLKRFADLFSTAADKVRDDKDFERFKDFTQAVVAYHRYHGGSNQ